MAKSGKQTKQVKRICQTCDIGNNMNAIDEMVCWGCIKGSKWIPWVNNKYDNKAVSK